jgi:hypothetical protein
MCPAVIFWNEYQEMYVPCDVSTITMSLDAVAVPYLDHREEADMGTGALIAILLP